MTDRDYELLKEYLGEEKLGELEVSIFNGVFDGIDSILQKNEKFKETLSQTPGLKEELHRTYRKSYFKEMVFQIANYARINNIPLCEVSSHLSEFEVPNSKDIYDDVCEDKPQKELSAKFH